MLSEEKIFTSKRCRIKYTETHGEASYVLESELPEETDIKGGRLIYVVKHESDFIYVGEAKTSLKTRFNRGFVSYRYFKKNNQARGWYKGYKWIDMFCTCVYFDVHAFVFPESYNNNRDEIEAIEGEIVLLIRNLTGKWPIHQNEIHFRNTDTARIIAAEIFATIQ